MLLSLLDKKVPNLLKYIVQYSTAQSGKNIAQKPTKILSSRQIQEACRHPNTVILQAINAVIAIQNALNATDAKIKELIKQRSTIENTLVSLLSINNQGSE